MQREDLDYLFVVTYGRSGSTLVAGLLNAIPGYLIRGENGNALHHLFHFHQALARESARPASNTRRRTHPWFGISDVPLERSIASSRDLVLDTVLRPQDDTRVTGFKEIRWYHDDLVDYVAWLREVFPRARFLVNTRDQASVLKSAWWAKEDPAVAGPRLARIESQILALADSLGDAAYRIHYDDFVADPLVLRGLYAWLGEPWDEASVRATLAVQHSIKPRS